jgi:hypothetical protein
MGLDCLLFRPGNIVRAKQSFYGHWKLHSSAGIRRKNFFSNGNVQHAPVDPKFLVYGCGLEFLPHDKPGSRLDAYTVAKPLAEIELNLARVQIGELVRVKSIFQMLSGTCSLHGSLQHAKAAWSSSPRKIHPFLETQLLASVDNF